MGAPSRSWAVFPKAGPEGDEASSALSRRAEECRRADSKRLAARLEAAFGGALGPGDVALRRGAEACAGSVEEERAWSKVLMRAQTEVLKEARAAALIEDAAADEGAAAAAARFAGREETEADKRRRQAVLKKLKKEGGTSQGGA